MDNKLYRWVKAGERMAALQEQTVFRNTETGLTHLGNFDKDSESVWIYIQSNGSHEGWTVEDLGDNLNNWEWLEEYTPPVPADLNEAAEEYAEKHCETVYKVHEYNNFNDLVAGYLAGATRTLPVHTGKEEQKPFQYRVDDWMQECFGEKISRDVTERNHRFLEESLELVQATGITKSECQQLVDYVFNRDIGEINQEIGGVMVTLVALCSALGLDAAKAGEAELARIWTIVEKVREKQANKPKHSPLPQSAPSISTDLVKRLRSLNPYKESTAFHEETWDECCDKLSELLKTKEEK